MKKFNVMILFYEIPEGKDAFYTIEAESYEEAKAWAEKEAEGYWFRVEAA